MMQEFKDFALKGNMLDLAVGVIIGGAFSGIVKSLVDDIIMPLISLLTGKIDFTNMFIALDGGTYATLDEAKAATSVLAYGSFLTGVINFLIMAFVVFMVIKELNKLYKKPAAPTEPTEKECPYCKSRIPLSATRCPHCTSQLVQSPEMETAAKQEVS
ncbi:large conductance mechanosensitive channel protein MscL [Clostridium sp. AM58-1XD]|uniref:large conductance mechanosensitive channel protein MscL n=1 Tax=Clostridium sp. AM58-1XD TaxID=2292307 RepID=UPI00325ABB20